MAVQTLTLPSSGRSTASSVPTLNMGTIGPYTPGTTTTGPTLNTSVPLTGISGPGYGPGIPSAQPAAAQPTPVARPEPQPTPVTEVQYDDSGNPLPAPDLGIEEAMPNYLSPNYRPVRSVGTGVAVAQPSYLQEMGTLPGVATGTGQDMRMSGADMARALSSYSPDSVGARLAAGYRQLFGREIDPTGAEHYLRMLGNAPRPDPNQPFAQPISQAMLNRILLGGAQGGDLEAARDYQLSLTGGRPTPGSPQFFQPVYQPESYANYRQIPFRQTQAPSMFGQMGFNPFAFSQFSPTVQSSYTGYRPFSGMMNPYARNVGSGVAVQRQMPQFRMPQYAFKQGGQVTDGIRAVRYLKR